MTWFKVDDNAPDHPKIARLSDRAFRWWFKGLAYASRFLTDGLLPPVFWKQAPKKSRAELSKGGLWDWDDPNFRIHDYLAHQSSRESVVQKKADNVDRVTRYREKKRNALHERDSNALQQGPGNALVTRPENREQIQRSDPKDPNTHTARANGHGRGANAPGALQRDHLYHALCSAKRRCCLSEKTATELAARWGGSPDDTSPVLQEFIDGLEAQIGDGPKGDYLWLTQHFEAFMHDKGRVPVAAPKLKVNGKESVIDQMDKWGRE